MLASAKACHGPAGALGALFAPLAEEQAGLLEGLADGGERQRLRLAGVRAAGVLHQLLGARVERRARGHLAVGRVDAAAGEHELARQEHVAVVALAHQHLRRRPAAVEQDQGGGVLGRPVGMAGQGIG